MWARTRWAPAWPERRQAENPGAAVGPPRHRELRRQGGLDPLDPVQMTDHVLRDSRGEAPDEHVGWRVTHTQGECELAMDGGRQLAIADDRRRRAGPADERLDDRRFA